MQALIEQLEATMDDAVLSGAEKRELRAALQARPLRPDQLAQLRNHAFELVHGHSLDPAAAGELPALIRWLGQIVRLLDQAQPQVAVQAEVWFSPGAACLDAVLGHLRSCRSEARICVFTIADDRISEAMLAAHRRGVQLRVISDDDKRFDRGSDIERLRDAGIAVAVDDSEAHMHHKFALFDDRRLLNGSFNWTRSASEANEENLVSSTDPRLIAHFAAQFEALWARFS